MVGRDWNIIQSRTLYWIDGKIWPWIQFKYRSSYKCGWKIHERPPTGGHMVLRINLFQIPFLFFPTTNQIGERPNFFDPGTIHQTPSSDPVSYFFNLSKKKFLMILIISKNPFWSICIFPNIFARPFLTFLNVYENICMIISDDFEYSWKYLSDPFWRFWIFLNDFLSPEKNSFFLLKLSLEHFWTQGSLMSLGFVQTERLNSICCQVEE